MINLLPPEDKIAIKKEYQRRLIVITGILMFSVIGSAIILLIPSYFLLSSREKNFKTQVSALKEIMANDETEKIESSISILNEKLKLLTNDENSQRKTSLLLKQISHIKPATVKLTAFSYDKGEEEEIFSIEGIAATRESFLSFLNNAEKMEGIKKITSPPSNLLKGENISFKLTIELSP